jgi:ADP-ribose pyrophosphatase YjhB (NUDIX family)
MASGGVATDCLADAREGERIVAAIIRAYGRLDGLIVNAGFVRDRAFAKMSQEEWDEVLSVHVGGAYACARAAWRLMSEQVHPRFSSTMKYCSECGLPIERRWVDQDQRERYACLSCNSIHYENPRIIVSCVICWHERILLCRRAEEPARGQWTLPSGFLECGETLEEGAARETFEETGVIVDPSVLELSSIMNITAIEQVAVTFRTVLTRRPDVRPGPECLDVAFMSEDEIAVEQFAWHSGLADCRRRFFKELRSGDFSIKLISVASSGDVGYKLREYKIGQAGSRDDGKGPA